MGSLPEHAPGPPPRPTIETIWREHLGFIHGWLRTFGVKKQDREDVASDIIVTILRFLRLYNPARGQLRAWIYRIIERHTRRYLRRVRKACQQQLVGHAGRAALVVPAATEDELLDRLFFEKLLGQIEPEKRRLVFIAFAIHGMTYAEICEAFSIPEGTAKTWVIRTREELQTAYRQHLAQQAWLGRALLPLSLALLLERIRESVLLVPDDFRPLRGLVVQPSAAGSSPRGGWSSVELPRLPTDVSSLITGAVAGGVVVFALLRPPAPSPAPIEPEKLPVVVMSDSTVTGPAMPVLPSPPEMPPVPAGSAHPSPLARASTLAGSRPRSDDSRLKKEISLMRALTDAYERGDVDAALRYANHHADEFPDGRFAAQRESIRAVDLRPASAERHHGRLRPARCVTCEGSLCWWTRIAPFSQPSAGRSRVSWRGS